MATKTAINPRLPDKPSADDPRCMNPWATPDGDWRQPAGVLQERANAMREAQKPKRKWWAWWGKKG